MISMSWGVSILPQFRKNFIPPRDDQSPGNRTARKDKLKMDKINKISIPDCKYFIIFPHDFQG